MQSSGSKIASVFDNYSSRRLDSVVKVEKKDKHIVDRTKKCPFHLKIYYSFGRHFSAYDYGKRFYPKFLVQINTWMDTTLEEVAFHLKRAEPRLARNGIILDFVLMTLENGIRYREKPMGFIHNGEDNPDNLKTLHECQFCIGDHLDVSVVYP